MTKFLQIKGYQYQVIAKYFDSKIKGIDYKSTDSILYNQYIIGLHRPRVPKQKYKEITDKYKNEVNSKVKQETSNEVQNSEIITGKLRKLIKTDELVFQTIDILKDRYIYYEFIPINKETKKSYIYIQSISQ